MCYFFLVATVSQPFCAKYVGENDQAKFINAKLVGTICMQFVRKNSLMGLEWYN